MIAKPIPLRRKLPDAIPVRCTESKDWQNGRAFRQYHNKEFNISMISTKKSHSEPWLVSWVCGDLEGKFETYALLKKKWEITVNGNVKKPKGSITKSRRYFK